MSKTKSHKMADAVHAFRELRKAESEYEARCAELFVPDMAVQYRHGYQVRNATVVKHLHPRVRVHNRWTGKTYDISVWSVLHCWTDGEL